MGKTGKTCWCTETWFEEMLCASTRPPHCVRSHGRLLNIRYALVNPAQLQIVFALGSEEDLVDRHIVKDEFMRACHTHSTP